jgi:CubicO group peptidase (beta-lactamase class C family)
MAQCGQLADARIPARRPAFAGQFHGRKKIDGLPAPQPLKRAGQTLDLAKTTTSDPLDQSTRSLAFLLTTRLAADGLLVMRNGQVVSEQYWHGLSAQQAWPLLGGTRPVLSLLGAMAVAQGKLAADRSVIRYIPALSTQTGLRKLSIQRLVEGDSRFAWSPQDLEGWRSAGGWKTGAKAGMRDWLAQPDRWDVNFAETKPGRRGRAGRRSARLGAGREPQGTARARSSARTCSCG